MKKDSALFREIKKEVFSIHIIDTHEHIFAEEDARRFSRDFSLFFSNYAGTDLRTSGMKEKDYVAFQDPETNLDVKWNLFSKYWINIKNTNYSRVILEAMRDLYGLEDITEKNYKELSDRIMMTGEMNWYDEVIKKSRVKLLLNHLESVEQVWVKIIDKPEFKPVINLDDVLNTSCREDIFKLEERFGKNIYGLRDLLDNIDGVFAKKDKIDYRGVKIAFAYMRPIRFDETTFNEAEKVFLKIFKLKSYGYLEKTDFLSKDELKPMQDYIIHYIIQKAVEYDLPVQIHTGIFENLWNDVSNSKPEYLVNLFMKYRKCNFDVFHAGYPYSDRLISICKQFPNVYFDLCWIMDISTHLYSGILNRIMDMIPSNKIFGFGGDYIFIEGLYGSQKLARKAISELLYKKIREKYFTFEEAIDFARKILLDNPGSIYGNK